MTEEQRRLLTVIVLRAERERWGIARITIALRSLMKGPKMDLVEAFRIAFRAANHGLVGRDEGLGDPFERWLGGVDRA